MPAENKALLLDLAAKWRNSFTYRNSSQDVEPRSSGRLACVTLKKPASTPKNALNPDRTDAYLNAAMQDKFQVAEVAVKESPYQQNQQSSKIDPHILPFLKERALHPRLAIWNNWLSVSPGLNFYSGCLKKAIVIRSIAYFNRRVTCLEWHPDPNFPTTLIVASKGGDLVWWDYTQQGFHRSFEKHAEEQDEVSYIYGQGAGGSITKLRFDPHQPNFVYTASIDGTVRKQDFEGRASQVFLDTMNKDRWYTSVEVGQPSTFASHVLFAGNTSGEVTLLTMDGRVSWQGKMHKGKVHDIEFHPKKSHLFVTAGHDKLLKFWDIRNLSTPLQTLSEDGIVTAATFSKMAPYRLLTTSQASECRVYDYDILEQTASLSGILKHPHRPFQHLTPIRADWHPSLPNVFAIGRYPEKATQDRRTVDMYRVDLPNVPHGPFSTYLGDGESRIIDTERKGSSKDINEMGGIQLLAKAEDPRVSGIHCLTKFSPAGDYMATCSGMSTYLWSLSSSPYADFDELSRDGKKPSKPFHFDIPDGRHDDDSSGNDDSDNDNDDGNRGRPHRRLRPFTVLRASGGAHNSQNKKRKTS